VFVDDLLESLIDPVALGQQLIQFRLAEDAPEGRLRDLRGGERLGNIKGILGPAGTGGCRHS